MIILKSLDFEATNPDLYKALCTEAEINGLATKADIYHQKGLIDASERLLATQQKAVVGALPMTSWGEEDLLQWAAVQDDCELVFCSHPLHPHMVLTERGNSDRLCPECCSTQRD